jgi:hypothetical protein
MKRTWTSGWKIYTVECTGVRIERYLPREPISSSRMDDRDLWG